MPTDHPQRSPSPAPLDRLSPLLERFRVRAHLFHNGPLCGVTHFAAAPGRGFLHVLRRGEMVVTHQPQAGPPERLEVCKPSLLFYARPLEHFFHNAPTEGSDFTCAALDFDGGASHPLARALPPLVVLILVYSGLPFLGLRISPLTAVVIAFFLNNAAYYGEIIRAGIESVPAGQWEAARSTGLRVNQAFTWVKQPHRRQRTGPPMSSMTSCGAWATARCLKRLSGPISSRTISS